MAVNLRSLQRTFRYYVHRLFPRHQPSTPVAASVALGVFIGVLPTLGVALILTAIAQQILGLPKGPGLVASFIAIPPTLFLFFYPLGYWAVGVPLMDPVALDFNFLGQIETLSMGNAGEVLGHLWHVAKDHLIAFMVGMTIVASITAAIAFVLTYSAMERRRRRRAERRRSRREQLRNSHPEPT
ncbi:MAG: DUF2062 domain-containing protein [Myxococcales bacterium]|nr:DUF2062 domain-containing protein [Myxococcales bacterium]MDD9965378.1 DUF2062 domain-containing protein [Myxococcales bacterium]